MIALSSAIKTVMVFSIKECWFFAIHRHCQEIKKRGIYLIVIPMQLQGYSTVNIRGYLI